jgi:hypothetical protein
VLAVDPLNYQSIVVNVANSQKSDNPMGKDPRVREAFELALDRKAINDVAFAGLYVAGNQPVAPGSPYYNTGVPLPERDVARAKKILQDAGYKLPVPFELLVPNRTLAVRVAEMMQAMVQEAGIDMKVKVVEFATTLSMTEAGDFQAWGPDRPAERQRPGRGDLHVAALQRQPQRGQVRQSRGRPHRQPHPHRDRPREASQGVSRPRGGDQQGPGGDLPLPPAPALRAERQDLGCRGHRRRLSALPRHEDGEVGPPRAAAPA